MHCRRDCSARNSNGFGLWNRINAHRDQWQSCIPIGGSAIIHQDTEGRDSSTQSKYQTGMARTTCSKVNEQQ
jgi:hypothetical protein